MRGHVAMTALREHRREESKRLAATPNGADKVYRILTANNIPFEKPPIATNPPLAPAARRQAPGPWLPPGWGRLRGTTSVTRPTSCRQRMVR